jgi:hypothetical protein
MSATMYSVVFFMLVLHRVIALVTRVLNYARRLQQDELYEVHYHAFNPDRPVSGSEISEILYDPAFSCSRCCVSFDAEDERSESTNGIYNGIYIFNECDTYKRTIGLRDHGTNGQLGEPFLLVRGGPCAHHYCYKCVVEILEEEQTKWNRENNVQTQVSYVQILFRKMLGLTADPLRLPVQQTCPVCVRARDEELNWYLKNWSNKATPQDTCPLCLEQPTEATMVLLCGHIMCSQCLREFTMDGVQGSDASDRNQSARFKKLKCPLCRVQMFPMREGS